MMDEQNWLSQLSGACGYCSGFKWRDAAWQVSLLETGSFPFETQLPHQIGLRLKSVGGGREMFCTLQDIQLCSPQGKTGFTQEFSLGFGKVGGKAMLRLLSNMTNRAFLPNALLTTEKTEHFGLYYAEKIGLNHQCFLVFKLKCPICNRLLPTGKLKLSADE